MADIEKISIQGTEYDVKDSSALHLTGSETASGLKKFTNTGNEFTGTLIGGMRYCYAHTATTVPLYFKLGEIIISGTYQSHGVQFMLQCGDVGRSGIAFGEISSRVESTAGIINTNYTKMVFESVFSELLPHLDDFRLYYWDNYDTNKAKIELWVKIKGSYTGCSLSILDTIGGGEGRNYQWSFYNNDSYNDFPQDATGYISSTLQSNVVKTPTEDTTSSSQIDTVGARNTKLANYVDKSSSETIGGNKTFNGTIKCTGRVNSSYYTQTAGYEQGVAPTSTSIVGGVTDTDKNGNQVSHTGLVTRNNGTIEQRLYLKSIDGKSAGQLNLTCSSANPSVVYATAPTPTEDTTSSTQIDTVGARNTKLANYVDKTSNEIIGGQKTFSNLNTFTYRQTNHDVTFDANGSGISIRESSDHNTYGKWNLYRSSNGDITNRWFTSAYNTNCYVDERISANGYRAFQFTNFDVIYGITPIDDTTSSRQIDTVGARNTKLANAYKINGNKLNVGDNNLEELAVLKSKTYTVTATTDHQSQATVPEIWCKITTTGRYDYWKIRFKVTVTGTNMSGVYFGTVGGCDRNIYSVYENTYSNNPLRHHYVYYPTSTKIDTERNIYLGESIYGGTNYTTVDRTIKIEVLSIDGCTLEMKDELGVNSDFAYNTTDWSCGDYNAADLGLVGSSISDTYDRTYYQERIKAGTVGIFPYTLVMQKPDGRWESIVTSGSTGTTKSRNTNGFLPTKVLYHGQNATRTNGNVVDNGTIHSVYPSIDMRYSFNISTTSLTQYTSTYLKGTIGDDGLFYLASTWWASSLPTTKDGFYYMDLGHTYSTSQYQMCLNSDHPIYYYDNGIKLYGAGNNSSGEDVVHKSGDETITGTKTFTKVIRTSAAGSVQTIGITNVKEGSYGDFGASDDSGYRIVTLRSSKETTGNRFSISLHNPNENASPISLISAGIKNDKTQYTSVIKPTEDTTTSTQIDTVGARNTKLQDYVKKTDAIAITPNLLDFKWADHLLNNQNWLIADTFSWQSGDVYKEVYEHLVNDWNNYTSITNEQINSITGDEGTFVLRNCPDGHRITDNETAVARSYETGGTGWYFVLDIANKRFKLPRTKWAFVGVRPNGVVGGYVNESLPNIKGGPIHINAYGQNGRQGALEQVNTGASHNDSGGTGTNVSFDASWYSSAYKDNAPVQQRATQMYLYFYVGQFSQTATEQTAGLNAELFNRKADINSPVFTGTPKCPTPTATSNSTDIATTAWVRNIPISTSPLRLTKYGDIGTTLPYTAPIDGFMYVKCGATYSWNLLINGTVFQEQFRNSSDSCVTTWTLIPVKKGDVLTFTSNAGHFDGGRMYYTY